MDVWGCLFRDHFEGRIHPHTFERDDGFEQQLASGELYFQVPRSEMERELLDALEGPGIDLGAGAGSYALYLEARGLAVTAVDASPGAIELCQRRGCRDARVMDMRGLDLPRGHYASFICMGNTLGIHQTPETLPTLLATLARAGRPRARLVCSMRDPLDTDEPDHVRYHQRNRERGLPPGLTAVRVRYREMMEPWARLWMPTRDELLRAMAGTGWSISNETSRGPIRLRLLELDETLRPPEGDRLG
jgi:SAM-dependent methyltransferase